MHRDLKPDNIMLTKNMKLKLIDFGNAKRKKDKEFVGTHGYQAPELFSGG